MCPLILIDRQLPDIKYLERFSCPLFVATNQIEKKPWVHNGPFKISMGLGSFYAHTHARTRHNGLWELSSGVDRICDSGQVKRRIWDQKQFLLWYYFCDIAVKLFWISYVLICANDSKILTSWKKYGVTPIIWLQLTSIDIFKSLNLSKTLFSLNCTSLY